MNWKNYEKEVHQYFSQMYPGAEITYDAKIIGRYSKKKRQLDVLIEDNVAGFPIKIVVDAKYFSKIIDVKCVESFISMMEDVEANQGLLVTNVGYSEAAINRAYYGPNKLDLDILNFDNLLKNQGLEALPYSANRSLLVSAPFGWVIDASKREYALTCLFQRGKNLDEAQKNHDWMYLNFWHKRDNINCIKDLIEFQNKKMESRYTNLKIESISSPKRDDNIETQIRIATADQLPCKEITGFLDCGDFIAFFVTFSIEQLESKNLRKLFHVLKYSKPFEIKFDNTKVIEQLKEQSSKLTDPLEKAEAYRQISDWYLEMGLDNDSIEYRRLSYKEYPENYANIKKLILGELKLRNWEDAKNISVAFFKMDPSNPRVMQDMLKIYDDPNYSKVFGDVIAELEHCFSDNAKALGNIRVHYGMYLYEHRKNEKAIDYLKQAKMNFESAFSDGHYVIDQIDELLKEIA